MRPRPGHTSTSHFLQQQDGKRGPCPSHHTRAPNKEGSVSCYSFCGELATARDEQISQKRGQDGLAERALPHTACRVPEASREAKSQCRQGRPSTRAV